MTNIKLEQYKIFNEVAATLSFSVAARNLFISQPAISQTIRQMEKELGVPLFLRHSKGVSLTQEGELLYSYTQDALNLITTATNKLSNFQDLKEGTLTLAAGDSFSEFFLTPFLSKFHELYPLVSIKVINRTSSEVRELLKTGQIDLGFMSSPENEESISFHECFSIQDIFVGRNPSTQRYSYKDIAKLPLILLEGSSTSRTYLEKQFAKQGLRLTPHMELGAHSLLLDCVKESFGVACVVKEFSQKSLNRKEVFELNVQPPLPKRKMGYAYLTRKSLSIASLKFIDLLQTT
ncbi:MAG: LysR family transcriptional regulator [Anaerorhabdus sp.]